MPVTYPPFPTPPDPQVPGQPGFTKPAPGQTLPDQGYAGPGYPGQGYPVQPQYGYGGPHYPPGMPYPPPVPRPTDGMAIAALICGMVAGPVGLILGIIALGRIRRSGAQGRGMAVAGIVLGALSIVATAILVVLAATGAFDTSPESITSARSIAADDLEPGHCANLVDIDDAGTRVRVLPCSEAHDTELVAEAPRGQYIAGLWDAQTRYGPECMDLIAGLAGADAGRLDAYVFPIIDSEGQNGVGNRYLCAASAPDSVIMGSLLLGDAELN